MENRGAALSFVSVSSLSISSSLWNLVMFFKEKNDFLGFMKLLQSVQFFSNSSNDELVKRHCCQASLHFDFHSGNYSAGEPSASPRFPRGFI